MSWFPSGSRAPARRAFALAAILASTGLHPLCVAAQNTEPVLVHAAASLSSVLPVLLDNKTQPAVQFWFDGTSRLASVLAEGAPGDVFVAADREWIDWLDKRGGIRQGSTQIVAENRLVVATQAGRHVDVGSLDDLTGLPRRSLALAGEVVPAGRYAEEALRNAGLWADLEGGVLRGGSARATAEWVATGEVALGVLYRSDVIADPRLEELLLVPRELHAPIRYVAAVLTGSMRPAEATETLSRLITPEAAVVWSTYGFGGAQEVSSGPGAASPSLAVPSPSSTALSLRAAVVRSVGVGLLATLLGLVPALGLGWLLARRDFPGKSLVSTLTLIPLVVPPVVTGFLLLWLLGARSPIGRSLTALGLQVPFTLLGAVVAAAVVGFPLYVLTIRSAFESVDRRYEDLAATLGDPPLRRFIRISLPLALPGVAAAAILAFARGLGEFGATIVLAGNLEGSTRTIPLAVYTLLESPTGRTQVWALVGASIGLCLIALAGYELLNTRLRNRTGGWRA